MKVEPRLSSLLGILLDFEKRTELHYVAEVLLLINYKITGGFNFLTMVKNGLSRQGVGSRNHWVWCLVP